MRGRSYELTNHGETLPPPLVLVSAGTVVVSITVLLGAVITFGGVVTVTLTVGELAGGAVTTDVLVVVEPPDARPIASPPPIKSAATIATTIHALLRLPPLSRRLKPQTGQTKLTIDFRASRVQHRAGVPSRSD